MEKQRADTHSEEQRGYQGLWKLKGNKADVTHYEDLGKDN